MSLVKTLAKVAIGIAAYKGVKGMMDQRSQTYDRSSGSDHARSAGLGGLLDKVGGRGGGLDRIVSNVGGSGGIGGLLTGLGLGGVAGGLAGGAAGAAGAGGGFAGKLDRAGAHGDVEASAEEEAVAALLLRAMIQAAKADGRIDPEERRRILAEMDEATPAEMDYLLTQMDAPADVAALARDVPEGLEPEVYAAALMAIDVDHPEETAFLARLAELLRLRRAEVEAIHREAGEPLPPPLPSA
ncbi:DUF533 domain-containing protein [Frigidibacter oleivorans]|uniref:DUF533 domain-containing protein n=1 Tax=Frigidibacter oleivorans TaxID=2487129 RepID=UPI000F8E23B0|nr:DUF533 domain-containing protein [Frigidibacter oleivorans]